MRVTFDLDGDEVAGFVLDITPDDYVVLVDPDVPLWSRERLTVARGACTVIPESLPDGPVVRQPSRAPLRRFTGHGSPPSIRRTWWDKR